MIIADTGFWLAIGNSQDQFHKTAVSQFKKIEDTLITTLPVVSETCYLLNSRVGHQATNKFLKFFADGGFLCFEIKPNHITRMITLIAKYRDLPMDFADASLVILAEETGTGQILSTDQRDFKTYRWKNTKPFQNLLSV